MAINPPVRRRVYALCRGGHLRVDDQNNLRPRGRPGTTRFLCLTRFPLCRVADYRGISERHATGNIDGAKVAVYDYNVRPARI